jgi:hypothetical protein
MYRLVTWRLPPSPVAKSDLPVDAKIHAHLLKPVQECNAAAPAALCDLIHSCLEINILKRPERASEIQGALDHLADTLVRSEEDRLEALEW